MCSSVLTTTPFTRISRRAVALPPSTFAERTSTLALKISPVNVPSAVFVRDVVPPLEIMDA